MYLFLRYDLEGVVHTLKHLFHYHLQGKNTAEGAEKIEDIRLHEDDFRKAKPFLDPVFSILHEDDHWEDVLKNPPRRIEVALLPIMDEDRRRFTHAGESALTLFISLPKGCVFKNTRRAQWGAHMPSRFHFNETNPGSGWYALMGFSTPISSLG